MATQTASTLTLAPISERSYAYADQGSITETPATGDIWRFFVIPAGTEITRITIQNTDCGNSSDTCPGAIEYRPIDASAAATTLNSLSAFQFGTAHTVAADGTSGASVTYILTTPVTVEKDSFAQVTFGTVSGTSGTITLQLGGRLRGPK